MHFILTVLIAFTDNIALLSFVIYYFMMITIPLAVLIRPHGLLCIDSIKNSVSHWQSHRPASHPVTFFTFTTLPPYSIQ